MKYDIIINFIHKCIEKHEHHIPDMLRFIFLECLNILARYEKKKQ